MLNHVNVVSQSKDEERDRLWKVAVLAVVGLAGNLLAISALKTFLATATSELLFVIAGAAFIGITVFVLQALFVKSPLLLRLVVLIETLIPLTLFFEHLSSGQSWVLWGAAALFFFFANMGSVRGVHQAAGNISIRFFDIARTVIPKVLTGMLIFMIALVYLTYFSWGTLNDAVGRRFVNQVLTSAEPAVRLYFSRTSVDMTVGEFLTEVVRSELQTGGGSAWNLVADEGDISIFNQLPVPQRDAIIANVAEGLRTHTLEPIFGPIDADEPIRDTVYRILEQRLSSLSPSQYETFTIGGVILIFLAIKGFLSLFHWLIAALAYVIFKLLMALGFARVGLATQSREFAVLT